MSEGGHDPREVLEAMRRMEADLGEMRSRVAAAQGPAATGTGLTGGEHQALVEDLEVLVDLVGSSWRTTRREIAAVAAEIADLRRVADEARASLTDMRFELRLVRDEAAASNP